MLLEPQSTNKIQYSEAFGQSYWTKTGTTIQGDPSTSGTEKVVNGDFATDTDWTKGTGWTIGSGVASQSGGVGQLSQVIGIPLETLCEITFTTTISVGGIKLSIGPSGLNKTFTESGTYTFQAVFLGNSTLYILGSDASFIGSIDNISVKEVSGFASPSADSPLGAFKLVEDTSNGNHRFLNSPAISINGDFSNSVFAKKGERNFIRLVNNNLVGAFFDLQNGVVVSVSSGFTADIKNYGNGWYKCSINGNRVGTQSERLCVYSSLDGVSDSYQGNGTSGVYIFGAQLEQKSYATSYMPNYGESAGVTRLAESCGQIPISGVIGQTEGTVYWEINVKTTVATANENILNIDAGSFGNTIYFSKSATGNLVGEIYLSGVLQASFTKTNITKGVHKMAMGYANNNTALFIDAIQIGTTDTSCTVPATNRIQLGNTAIGPSDCLSNDLKLYNTRLSNSELQALTTI